MKLKPFKELVALSKEKIDEAMAPIRARQVRAQADLETAQLDADLVSLEKDVQELCIGKTIDFKKLIDKLDDISLLERRKEQYDEVVKQLFPETKKGN